MFTSRELVDRYLEFFVGKRHVVIPSASLVPANDPTVLFTTAGMHPLVPYLSASRSCGHAARVGAALHPHG